MSKPCAKLEVSGSCLNFLLFFLLNVCVFNENTV